jgi:signal transduction histidine kinase
MRRIILITFVLVLGLCLAENIFAESATKEECIAKVKEAAKICNERGIYAAIAEINNKEGMFVWKNTYVFVFDLDGTLVARALRQKSIGKNFLKWQDYGDPPKQPIKEMVDLATNKGEGWVEYTYPKPEEMKKPPDERIKSKKLSYISRVPGKDLLVGAGIYE